MTVRILYYATLHTTHATSGQLWLGERHLQVSQAKMKKRPPKWVRPPTQRDRLEEKRTKKRCQLLFEINQFSIKVNLFSIIMSKLCLYYNFLIKSTIKLNQSTLESIKSIRALNKIDFTPI